MERVVTALFLAQQAFAYTWPSPRLDVLEGMRWDQLGYSSFEPALFVTPCDRYTHPTEKGSKGVRSNAADWVRAAYHDMATYNVETGLGGLDASIRFGAEQSRPENPGSGFNNTIQFIAGALGRHFSLADGLALLVPMAVENCGGPEIDFRGGRVDATEPNAAGVPEPDQDIETHTAAFKRQGFSPTEMIGLVACGHSFGSVQSSNFPDVVKQNETDPTSETGVAFDSTMTTFDNAVAAQYINGTTTNPLVAGLNATKNSDSRIFSSDRNATMAAFARNPAHFAATCKHLFERMINTVPKSVHLTEVIRPLPVKPVEMRLTYRKDGTIALSGDVRLFNVSENDKRTVDIVWKDSLGQSNAVHRAAMPHTAAMKGSAQASKIQNFWYGNRTFLATVEPERGFGAFHFEVDGHDGLEARIEDQGGLGFALPTDAVMISEETCEENTHVAVRANAGVQRVFLEIDQFTEDSQGSAAPLIVDLVPSGKADKNGFVIWSGKSWARETWSTAYGIVAVINNKRLELPQENRNDFC
ncbi:heme peroxidase [Exidia glandulosa HHB12029]|uniref:Peroxidase n=1 Tax=Exidia glandulosa HHB12029 TaxID=1314781 RepID=A0A165F2D1_EXIGL|nr:heme peroxidase [Exidia glandulosa HHB12029]